MASFKEIDRIRKDPASFQDIARRLLKLYRADLSEWELDFLQPKTTFDGELTTRQAEMLLVIRDDMEDITEALGFSVKLLLEGLYQGRADLSEAQEEWVVKAYERSRVSMKRKFKGRLLRCARQLNLIEVDLDDETRAA